MKKILLIVAATLLFAGCNSCEKENKSLEDEIIKAEESAEAADMHTAQISLDYEGTYTGAVLVEGQEELCEVTLLLAGDEYIKTTNIGGQELEIKGKYEWMDDGTHIKLIESDAPYLFFVAENRLFVVDQELNKLKNEEGEIYTLTKE